MDAYRKAATNATYQGNVADFLISKANAGCLRGQELRVYAGRAFALLRLGSLAFAFFEIAVELLDQVQNRWRFIVVVDCWHYFPGMFFAVAPHIAPFPAIS